MILPFYYLSTIIWVLLFYCLVIKSKLFLCALANFAPLRETMQELNKKAWTNVQFQRLIAIASCVLLMAKFLAYFLTHSVAILTDALESIVNVAAGFIGLYSLHVAAKPRDIDHPYGHGKAEFVSAAIEGTLVLSAGVLAIYNGAKSFINTQPVQQLDTGIILVAATGLINWLMGAIAKRKGRQTDSLALVASGRHLQTDTYSTIGIIISLLLIYYTRKLWIDGVVAIGFGLFIIYTGYSIVRQSLAGIMDEADVTLLQNLVRLVNKARQPSWVDLHNLRVIKYGNVLHVDCHVTLPWYFNINEAHIEVDAFSALIRNEYGESVELFVHTDGCQYFQCPLCQKKDCPVRQHAFLKKVEWTLDNVLQNEKHVPEYGNHLFEEATAPPDEKNS